MNVKPQSRRLYILGTIIFLVSIAGIFSTYYIGGRAYSIMLIAVGLIIFFGFLRIDNNFRIDERSMRTAITSTVFLSYIILFGTVIFWTSDRDLPPIAETLLVHFTTIVGVVIAAQFGVSAYTEVKRRNETESNTTADPTNEQNSEEQKS